MLEIKKISSENRTDTNNTREESKSSITVCNMKKAMTELHQPQNRAKAAIVLTHGTGSNCRAPLLIQVAQAFADAGFLAMRCDLAFRVARPTGPPFPAGAAADRESLRTAVASARQLVDGPCFLGGHSYGGRQATMLAAEDPSVADALLLLSYPLHPPNKPAQLRTDHFPKLQIPSLFIHGSRDPFGTLDEIRAALKLIPAVTDLLEIENAGHDLKRRDSATRIVDRFLAFTS